jgi:hypothetical protein
VAGAGLGLAVLATPTADGTGTVVFGLGAAFSVVCATTVFVLGAEIGGTAIDMVTLLFYNIYLYTGNQNDHNDRNFFSIIGCRTT